MEDQLRRCGFINFIQVWKKLEYLPIQYFVLMRYTLSWKIFLKKIDYTKCPYLVENIDVTSKKQF